ncbi:hypothetical protein UPYG_G00342030 [Umbra pygmaea]|uniref:Uncharacterized protein n=1 Tax=Umbra pygmaea TaxID=75934 RepID=A0ABD0VXA3_UMBPY
MPIVQLHRVYNRTASYLNTPVKRISKGNRVAQPTSSKTQHDPVTGVGVNTLSDTAGVVKDSTVTGHLVGLEDGTVLVERYDWLHQLTPYFRPLPQIKQYQHFRFYAAQHYYSSSKGWSASISSTWTQHSQANL